MTVPEHIVVRGSAQVVEVKVTTCACQGSRYGEMDERWMVGVVMMPAIFHSDRKLLIHDEDNYHKTRIVRLILTRVLRDVNWAKAFSRELGRAHGALLSG